MYICMCVSGSNILNLFSRKDCNRFQYQYPSACFILQCKKKLNNYGSE